MLNADASQYLCGMVASGMTKTATRLSSPPNPFGGDLDRQRLPDGRQAHEARCDHHRDLYWRLERSSEERAAAQGIDGRRRCDRTACRHADTAQIVAQERKGFGTGHHRDLSEFASKGDRMFIHLVLDRYLTPEIKKIVAGNWKPNPYGAFPSVKDGPSDIAINKSSCPKNL